MRLDTKNKEMVEVNLRNNGVELDTNNFGKRPHHLIILTPGEARIIAEALLEAAKQREDYLKECYVVED